MNTIHYQRALAQQQGPAPQPPPSPRAGWETAAETLPFSTRFSLTAHTYSLTASRLLLVGGRVGGYLLSGLRGHRSGHRLCPPKSGPWAKSRLSPDWIHSVNPPPPCSSLCWCVSCECPSTTASYTPFYDGTCWQSLLNCCGAAPAATRRTAAATRAGATWPCPPLPSATF